jgi:hypothetical protein
MAQAKRNKQSQAAPPPPRRGHSAPIAGDSNALTGAAYARQGFADPTLVLRWAEIAGPEIAHLTIPVKLSSGANGGTLTLKTEPGASLFLAHETRDLCDRINAYLGRVAVTKLRFVQSPLTLRPPPPDPRKPRKLDSADPAQRFEGKDSLREALLSLARWRRSTDH